MDTQWTISGQLLTFFPDYFFTSANLMRDLELRGTYTCSTVHTDRRDYPAELKHAKLVPGEIRTHQCRIWWLQCEGTNMLYLSNQQTLLWSPRSKLYSRLCEKEESELSPQTWRKSQMWSMYNKGMNGVNANDQYQSYYTQGSVSQKRCKYLPWFFLNLSIINGYILEKVERRCIAN